MNRAPAAYLCVLALTLVPQAAARAAEPGPGNSLTIAAKPNPVGWVRVTAISGTLLGPNAGDQTVHSFMDHSRST